MSNHAEIEELRARNAELVAEMQRTRKAADDARAEMEERGKALANWQAIAGEHQRQMFDAMAERDRLAEQVKRAQDPDVIRRAIADPGAYVKRKLLDNGEPAETVPAWSARAVIAVIDGTEA